MKVLSFLPPGTVTNRIAGALTARRFVIDTAVSVRDCTESARRVQYAAILVYVERENHGDVMILVKSLRHEQPTAALFVFERHLDLHQRLQLFDAGADDCVRERFCASELAVRLNVSIKLRQAAFKPEFSEAHVNILRSGDLELDLVRRKVTRLGKPIDLRPKEFLLLEYLMRNANRSVSRTMILEHVWQSSFEGLTNVVDVYISALRNKVDRDFKEKLIQTNRGIGYTFRCLPPKQSRDGSYMVARAPLHRRCEL